jgi:hypothetical protein
MARPPLARPEGSGFESLCPTRPARRPRVRSGEQISPALIDATRAQRLRRQQSPRRRRTRSRSSPSNADASRCDSPKDDSPKDDSPKDDHSAYQALPIGRSSKRTSSMPLRIWRKSPVSLRQSSAEICATIHATHAISNRIADISACPRTRLRTKTSLRCPSNSECCGIRRGR